MAGQSAIERLVRAEIERQVQAPALALRIERVVSEILDARLNAYVQQHYGTAIDAAVQQAVPSGTDGTQGGRRRRRKAAE